METMQLHRGRLIDHIQLVVRDLGASRRFYGAVFEVIGVPIAGEGEDYFWADELFVSTADSAAAAGKLTGRHHIAFQARTGRRSIASTAKGWKPAAPTMARRASGPIIPAIMARS